MLMKAHRQKNMPYLFVLLSLAYFTVVFIPFAALNRDDYPNLFLFLSAAYMLDRMMDVGALVTPGTVKDPPYQRRVPDFAPKSRG
ncbi:hypothetical protein [Paenibacillus harenae]|uniref:hypothetical protein n=1 Tax=Paenibacillus harenae TaxID=306543 RepID=UPI0004168D43|nr:hypothetical protein [Paenibacillus harenae]